MPEDWNIKALRNFWMACRAQCNGQPVAVDLLRKMPSDHCHISSSSLQSRTDIGRQF